ncbi:hypothetical protein [Lactococcus allomyrinae]|uniref:Uncharacterized protein n=1 Tax=Lactococcus allomyrinae TaxID=2419773 RepID=A0A387BFE2_9LACT|nr:hypothetical protein [Lactococcus allomyrinae]AYF99825.1 hypothetical protein D7I46_01225 [Lactococcus allomyrinae]
MASKLAVIALLDTCGILQEQTSLAFSDLKRKIKICDDFEFLSLIIEQKEPHETRLSDAQKKELSNLARTVVQILRHKKVIA